MVNADTVVDSVGRFYSADPPVKPGAPVVIPVVKWIAPELSGCGEGVGRAASYLDWIAAAVEQEEFVVSPGVSTVKRDIDGNIANNGNTFLPCIFLEFVPLAEK